MRAGLLCLHRVVVAAVLASLPACAVSDAASARRAPPVAVGPAPPSAPPPPSLGGDARRWPPIEPPGARIPRVRYLDGSASLEQVSCLCGDLDGGAAAMVGASTIRRSSEAFATCGASGDRVKLAWTAKGGRVVAASAGRRSEA